MHVYCVQDVCGLLEGDPVYWEPGRLKLSDHSKQALAVSRERGRSGEQGEREEP